MRGLLRGGKAERETIPVEGRDDLVLAPDDEVEEMVSILAAAARDYVENGDIVDGVARALSMGFALVTGREAATKHALAAAESIARFGYMARVAEWESVTASRKPVGWMIVGLRVAVRSSVAEELDEADDRKRRPFYDALADVTAFLVRREPVDVPFDAAEGFVLMWTIPGVGGEVRALLREKTIPMVLERDAESQKGPAAPIEGATMEDLRRVWKYGFLLRSFEEFFRDDYQGPTR